MKYYVFYNSIAEDYVREFDTLDEVKVEINRCKDDNFVNIYNVVLGDSIYDPCHGLKEDE